MPAARLPRALLPVSLALLLLVPGTARPGPAATGPPDAGEKLARIEQAVSGTDRSALPTLREWAARDASERVRERSVGALTLLRDDGAAGLFLDRLSRDPSPRVRRAAAEAAGVLRLTPLRSKLAELLGKERDPYVRSEIARAMGKIPGTDGGPLLAALVADPSPEVRALCAEALSSLKVPESYDLLRGVALQDPSLLVRIYAVRALADRDPAASAALFRETWKDSSDPDLRVEAYRGLLLSGKAGDAEEDGFSDIDERVRFQAFRSWLSRNFPPVKKGEKWKPSPALLARLEGFLSDPVRGIRELAREEVERQGFRTRPSGFGYAVER